MVVYDSGDSDLLIQAMTTNLNSAKAIFNRLCRGSAHLIEVINSGVLSGAAYEAGKELFVAYINPMLQKLSQAITDIENDLNSYTIADYAVRQYENHLDEALLKKQLNATKELIRLLQQKIDDDQDLIKNLQSAANGDFKKIAENMAELPDLYAQLENLEQVKSMYDQQIAALETFVSSTTPLFTDSLQAFKYAMQGVDIINQSRANFDGQITFPAGADMSWTKELNLETFDSTLLTFDNLLTKEYGFSGKEISIIQSIYEKLKKEDASNASKNLFLFLSSFVYNGSAWSYTSGAKSLDEVKGKLRELGISNNDIDTIEKAVINQHNIVGFGDVKAAANAIYGQTWDSLSSEQKARAEELFNQFHDKVDFAHLSATVSAHYNNSFEEELASGLIGGPLDSKAGYLGDATGANGKKPSMGNDDYRADLDAVNLYHELKSNSDFESTVVSYYANVETKPTYRAKQFVTNIGNGDYRDGVATLQAQWNNFTLSEEYKNLSPAERAVFSQFLTSVLYDQKNLLGTGEVNARE
jgi:hypothetical protein